MKPFLARAAVHTLRFYRSPSELVAVAPSPVPSEPWYTEPWRLHDAFNLATLPPAIILVTLALAYRTSFNRPLALYMLVYMLLDALWIGLQPFVVKSPEVLLVHHVGSVLLLLHSLTYAPHLRYAAWMIVVEVNTLLLIARRHFKSLQTLLNAAFYATWLAIRVVWFPVVAVHLWRLPQGSWPSVLRRVAVCGTVSGLASLQLWWTRAALKPMLAAKKQEGTQKRGSWL